MALNQRPGARGIVGVAVRWIISEGKEKGEIEEKVRNYMNGKCEVERNKERFRGPDYFRVSFTASLQALIASI